MTGRVLHRGALLSLARGSIYMASLLRWAADHEVPLAVPAGSLAQAARLAGEDLYRLQLALSVHVMHVIALDEHSAVTVGELCATTDTADLVAAHSAWVAASQQWAIVAAEEDQESLRAVAPGLEIELVP